MPPTDAASFAGRHRDLLSRLFRRSGGSRWGLAESAFAAALERSARRRFGETIDDQLAREYLGSLHLEDLALATACLDGKEPAWEHLVAVYRPDLRKAGRALAGPGGDELADGIFAELYGLDEIDPDRKSLLKYFHGRSRLSTWLRTVLAQRHVDGLRAVRRLSPLDEDAAAAVQASDPAMAEAPEPRRDRYAAAFRLALVAAIGALPVGQRQRLAWHYAHQLTLAQIGRLFGEHEATVSRKLERARRDLRSAVERDLRERQGFTEAEVRRSVELGLPTAEAEIARFFSEAGPARPAELPAARPPRVGATARQASSPQG